MTPLPKAVVFDLGKVLLDFDYSLAARHLAGHTQANPDAIKQLICHPTLLYRYETGELTSEEFHREVCAATGFRGDFNEFSRLFSDIFSPIPSMIEFQAQLRERGIPRYVFSNTNDLAIRHIRQHFPFFNTFDGYVLSYEHGVMKPDVRLYEVVERLARRRNGELLYVDDRPENTATGAARGWQVIVHESPEKTLGAIRDLGL